MLSYASGTSMMPLIGQTIGENLERSAAAWPDNEALVVVHQGVRLTYRQFDDEVNAYAGRLMGLGLEKGDRLGIWSPNCAEWALVQYATAKIGVILVNLNPAYRTHEVEYALRQSGCVALVAATDFKTSDYRAMVAEVRPNLPHLCHVLFIGTDDWRDWLDADPGVTTAEVLAYGATLSFDDPINIQYTSGTTGFPKGATLSHHNILNNGYFVADGCRYTDQFDTCTLLYDIILYF